MIRPLEVKKLPFQLNVAMSTVCFDEYVYFVGGTYINKIIKPETTIIEYSPMTNTCVTGEQLTIPVCQAGLGVLNKSIYIVNGVNETSNVVTTVQRYIPSTKTCESVADTNQAHNLPQIVTMSGYLFALGSNTNENSVERYDPESDEWTVITNIPGSIDWCAASMFECKLMVAPKYNTNDLLVYDFISNQWDQKTIAGMPDCIHGMMTVSINGRHCFMFRDEERTFHVFDDQSEDWIWKSKPSVEPLDCYLTCVT